MLGRLILNYNGSGDLDTIPSSLSSITASVDFTKPLASNFVLHHASLSSPCRQAFLRF